jgi:hypothetical protein
MHHVPVKETGQPSHLSMLRISLPSFKPTMTIAPKTNEPRPPLPERGANPLAPQRLFLMKIMVCRTLTDKYVVSYRS